MAQADYTIANQTFPATRSDINSNLAAIQSSNSGASSPSDTAAYMPWADTTNGVFKSRNAADSGWILQANASGYVASSITTNTTLAVNNHRKVVPVDASGGNVTLTLPAASGNEDLEYVIYREDASANTVTIDGNASETINGGTTYGLTQQYDAVNIICDGTNWLIKSISFETLTAAMIDSTVNAIGSIGGGTQDIDLDLGRTITATVDTSTTTFTFSNPLATGNADAFDVYLTNGGSQTVNWPASVDWAGGTAPTLTSSGLDHLVFTTTDGGTTWYGYVAGLDLK